MTLTQLFTSIANAIRSKTGSSSKIIAEDFPNEISNISTGTDTSDATATAGDILESKTAYAVGQKLTGTYRWDNTTEYNQCLTKANTILEDDTYNPIQLQEKSVTITQNGTQTISPDTGYDGITELEVTTNVEPDLSEYFTPTITKGSSSSHAGLIDCIKSIPSSMTFVGTNASYAFSFCKGLVTIPLLNTSSITDMSNMFRNCEGLTSVPLLNTSNVSNMSYMFYGCIILTTIPLLNTSNVTYMDNMFSLCSSLTNIPLLDTGKTTTFTAMFNQCTKLTTVPQLDTSKATAMRYMFNNCPNLSNDSLNNILAMCANATSYTDTKTLAYIGLSSAQATTCTGLSNYAAFTAAGWTTGY